jgi:hypothetical protein
VLVNFSWNLYPVKPSHDHFLVQRPKPCKPYNLRNKKESKYVEQCSRCIFCSNSANIFKDRFAVTLLIYFRTLFAVTLLIYLRTVIFVSLLHSCCLAFQHLFIRCSVADLKLSIILPISLCSLLRWKLCVFNLHQYKYKLPNKVCTRRNLRSPCHHISYIPNVITGTVHVNI